MAKTAKTMKPKTAKQIKPKMAKKMKHTPKSYLPMDIISLILFRLPVNSLTRLRCVCKSWNRFIRSSTFVSAYRHHRSNNSEDLLICFSNDTSRSLQDCTLISSQQAYNLAPLPLPGCTVVGVCEGLVCLVKRSVIYIWNPLTGILKEVPAGKIKAKFRPDQRFAVLGFGFAPRSGDYRVVKILDSYKPFMEIYSLSANKWRKRRIRAPAPVWTSHIRRIPCWESPVFFKGFIYWVSRMSRLILRFDVEEERFDKMDAPAPLLDGDILRRNILFDLVVVDGFLVFLKVRPIKRIYVTAYINKEAGGGSESGWSVAHTHVLPNDRNRRGLTLTKAGHIALQGTLDWKILAYDCYYDGNDFYFKLRDLGVCSTSKKCHVVSIKPGTLFLQGKAK